MPRKRMTINNDQYNKPFPSALRELMDKNKTTQQELADVLGKTRQSISYYCDGSSSPDWETLAKIAKFFSVSTDYLVGETLTKSPNVKIQAICKFTGLSEAAIMNLHNESKDAQAISALDKVLSNDFEDIHRLDMLIYKALKYTQNCKTASHIWRPLGYDIPDDRKAEFFAYLEKFDGEILSPKAARDYYISQAAHIFQRIVENVGNNARHINLDDL